MQLNFNSPPAPLRNPANSDKILLGLELTFNCNGAQCGLTPEHNEEMPRILPAHWHIVVTGEQPHAGPWCYFVYMEPIILPD